MSPDFPGESPGIVWNPAKWTDSALASVSMGYQVGVTPLQMVTAISSVANGGELIEPRVIRAVYRDNRRYAVQPKIVRRTVSADTAATLTGDHGRRRRATAPRRPAQMPGYTVAGKTGTAAKLVNGHYSTSDYNASFVGFVPSRNPGDRDHRRHRFAACAGRRPAGRCRRRSSSASPRRRCAISASARSINPPSPVLVARHDETAGHTPASGAARGESVVSLVADGPPGTVPDLRGLSARDAVRKLVKLGMNARATGDGFVISQTPEPGAPIDGDSLCRLVLERRPPRHGATASRP